MLILAKLLQVATGRYATLVLLLVLGVQGWLLIRPSTPPLDEKRAEAADTVAAEAAAALGAAAGTALAGRYVQVARFENDPDGHVRGRLEAALPAHTNARVVPETVAAGLRDELADKAARLGAVNQSTADAWKARAVADAAGALEVGRARGLDCVVFGRVAEFRALHGVAHVRLEVGAVDTGRGETIFEGQYEYGDGAAFASVPGAVLEAQEKSAALRLVGWLLFTLLLPMVSAGFWARQLDRESNAVNAAALLFLTGMDALLAWALLGFWLPGFGLKAVLAVAAMGAGAWNLFVLATIERNRAVIRYAGPGHMPR